MKYFCKGIYIIKKLKNQVNFNTWQHQLLVIENKSHSIYIKTERDTRTSK